MKKPKPDKQNRASAASLKRIAVGIRAIVRPAGIHPAIKFAFKKLAAVHDREAAKLRKDRRKKH